MSLGRNEKCHCGSGKKYKNCCLQKDLEQKRIEEAEARMKAVTDSAEPEKFEENDAPQFPTWKIFVIGTSILAILGIVVYLVGMPRLGGSIFGAGMLILIVYCAFRNEPTVRKRPGDAGNIDFGNRQ